MWWRIHWTYVNWLTNSNYHPNWPSGALWWYKIPQNHLASLNPHIPIPKWKTWTVHTQLDYLWPRKERSESRPSTWNQMGFIKGGIPRCLLFRNCHTDLLAQPDTHNVCTPSRFRCSLLELLGLPFRNTLFSFECIVLIAWEVDVTKLGEAWSFGLAMNPRGRGCLYIFFDYSVDPRCQKSLA